ncbi:MAG: hypothetical protein J6U54_19725, partial [Clostridiales bacterium]|nr:hypothetical protein [Clostridiales bacterium]
PKFLRGTFLGKVDTFILTKGRAEDMSFTGLYPSFNFSIPNVNYISIPRVRNSEEAEKYPLGPNSEMVLLHASDDTILYFKKTDAQGFSTVVRYRYYPDPEPTQQEINDQRYVTIEEFNKLKEELLNATRQSNWKRRENQSTKKDDERV